MQLTNTNIKTHKGLEMLNLPQFNRGTGFTAEERDAFNLHGFLPAALQTLGALI